MATITKIKNIFEPIVDSNRMVITPPAGTSLSLYMYGDYLAIKNNERLPATYIIQEHDNITITPIIRGGGGSSKQIISMVAIIALLVVAPYMAAFATLMISGTATTLAVIQAAVVIGGSMLINSLLAPDVPSLPTMAGIETSQSYSWAGAKTKSQIGNPIPVLYGTMRLPGNVINSAVDYIDANEYLRLQLALCNGPVNPITQADVLINGTLLQEFTGPDYPNANPIGIFESRTGTYTQAPSSIFSFLNSNVTLSLDLTQNVPVTRNLAGSGFTELEVILKAPQGIYSISSTTGAITSEFAAVKVEFREAGTDDIWGYIADTGEVRDTLEYEVVFNSGIYSEYWWVSAEEIYWFEDPNLDLTTQFPELLDKVNYPNAYAYYTGTSRYKTELEPVVTTWFFYNPYWGYPEAILMQGDKTNPVTRTIRIPVDPTKDYEIRVTKQDPDSTTSNVSDTINWYSINGKVAERLNYPGVANASFNLKATDQLNSSPNFSILVTKSPITLYDDTGTYAGIGPSNVPAWAAWDFLTNQQYGAGIPYTDIDFQSFAEWAVWSQVTVDNGRGEFLPRATFNGVFDYNTNIWEAVSKIALAGRASIIIRGTKYGVVVDKPTAAVQTFSMGNILADSYSTVYTPVVDIATEVEVQFLNKDKDYTQDQISVQVPEFYPVDVVSNKTTVSAMGIVSEAEAYRWGRYLLATSKFQRRHITFDADIDSIACSLGDVINFSHDVPQWGESGRIVSVDVATNTITLDREIAITAGESYTIMIRFIDDTSETLAIVNPGDGLFSEFVAPDMVRIPDVYDIYTFGIVGNSSKLFRISSITRADDQTRTITASEYNESVINDDTTILPTPVPYVRNTVPTISNVVFSEHLEKRLDGTIVPFIDISWDISDTDSSSVSIYISDTAYANFVQVGNVRIANSFTLQTLNLVEGQLYYFKFQVQNSVGVTVPLSDLPEYTYTYLGKLAPPTAVSGFTLTRVAEGVRYDWVGNTEDPDFSHYELEFANAVIVAGLNATTYTHTATLLPQEYTGAIYAVDTTGNYSIPTVEYITIDVPTAITGAAYTRIKDGIEFTWDANTDIAFSHYVVKLGATIIANGLTAPQFTYIASTPVGVYDYEIYAVDTSGNYSLATTVPVTISAPTTVTGAAYTRIKDGLEFTWDANTDIAFQYYSIEILGVPNTKVISELTTSGYTHIAPVIAGDYTYLITTFDTSGNASTPFALAVSIALPTAVTSLTATRTNTGVDVSWDANTEAFFKAYEVRLDGSTISNGGTTTQFSYNAPITVGAHTVTVFVIDTSGNYSLASSVPLVIDPVQQVSNFAVTLEADGLLLSWDSVFNSYATYNIYAQGTLIVSGLKATTYKYSVARFLNLYTFEIEAVNTFGEVSAVASSVQYDEVGPPTVVGFTHTFEDDGILLSWTPSTYVNHIAYAITLNNGDLVTDLKATTYKIARNLPFGSYNFEIKAIDKFGIQSATGATQNVVVSSPGRPTATHSIQGENLETTMEFTKTSFPFSHFRITYDAVDINVSSTLYTVPIFWSGEKVASIYGVDTMGNQSPALSASVNILPGVVTKVLPEVIDNNVLLYWESTAGTLPITNFNVYKGDSFATAKLIGSKKGSFTSVFESIKGIYTYWVEPIDSAGNLGTPHSAIASVSQPPDYILKVLHTSLLDGTSINSATTTAGSLLIPVNLTDTYQEHFDNNLWASAQDQVTAGYTRWISPFETSGSYEEILDLGTILGASSITVTADIDIIDTLATYVVTTSTSANGIDWIDYIGSTKVYGTNFQYVKVRYDVTSDTYGAFQLNSLEIKLDSKLINDSGMGIIPANSTLGHTVNFNIPFVDVTSISLSAGGTTPVTLIYDFVDSPNPTSFDVYAYDSNGVIMTTPVTFSWAIKGY